MPPTAGTPIGRADKEAVGIGMPNKQTTEATGDNTAVDPIGERIETFMKARWEDLRTAYTVYHQICWQNILYYAGQLWILWDKDRRLWYPAIPEDEYTPQPVINDFAPAIDSITSVFRIPEVEAVPKVEDDMDGHEIAEIANALVAELAKTNGMADGGCNENKDGVGDRAGQLFTLTGNLFTIVSRKQDSVINRPVIETVPMVNVRCPQCNLNENMPPTDPRLQAPPSTMLMGQQVNNTPCPQCGSNMVQMNQTQVARPKLDPLSQAPVTEPIIKWKVVVELGNPMFALPRPGVYELDKSGYVVWAQRLPLDTIYEEYKFEAQPDNQYLDSMEASWEISMNYYFTGYSNLTLATKESALVLRIFIEPGKIKDLPEGGLATMINDRVIDYKSWDEVCVGGISHPLTHFGYLCMPTTFFYRTPAFDLAQVQKELLRYESIIALHAMTSSADSLIVDENTKVSNITGRGDRIIYWRSIGPGSREPHRLLHGSLDNGIYEQRQRLRDALQNISGAVAVWRGQQTGSVTSAAGISQLRGQAEQMFSKPTANWNNGWVTTFTKAITIMQQTMEPWEIGALVGPGRDTQIAKFKQADLTKTLDWVSATHGLPKSRDEKRQDMITLYDRKLLDVTDPAVKQRIGELFGDTGIEDNFNLDATRARAENDILAKGGQVQFMPDIEDLQVHMFIHGQRIKRLDFDQLEDPAKQGLYEHYMETKMAFNQLMLMNTESQVEYKAAAIGKSAPEQPQPGTLLGGGPNGGANSGNASGGTGGGNGSGAGTAGGVAAPKGSRGGRLDGGPHARKPVAAGQSTVPTGPAPKGGRRQ